jgi:hypothetical protein
LILCSHIDPMFLNPIKKMIPIILFKYVGKSVEELSSTIDLLNLFSYLFK